MTTRPPLVPRETRKTVAKRDAALAQGLRLEFGGRAYEVRVGDVTPHVSRQLRAATGLGFLELLESMSRSPDVDLVSAFVWVARLLEGEQVTLDEVDAEVTYAVIASEDFQVGNAGDEVDAGPEA